MRRKRPSCWSGRGARLVVSADVQAGDILPPNPRRANKAVLFFERLTMLLAAANGSLPVALRISLHSLISTHSSNEREVRIIFSPDKFRGTAPAQRAVLRVSRRY